MQEEREEHFAHEKHWNTASEFNMKDTEVVVYESEGLTDCQRKLTLQNYPKPSEEIDVVKANW